MKHLTQVQRYEICAYLKAGLNNKEIAECLSVHRSTIGREIERNGYGRYRTYKPSIAQERTESRWRKRKLPRRFSPETYATAGDLHLDSDRKSTRLNSSHQIIPYAVFCLKKKKPAWHPPPPPPRQPRAHCPPPEPGSC